MPVSDFSITMVFLKRVLLVLANIASMNLDATTIPLLVGVVVSAVSLGYVSMKFERSSLHYATLLWQCVVFTWSIINLACYVSPDEEMKWRLVVSEMFIRCLATWTWIFFAYAYTRRHKHLSWLTMVVAAVPYVALWLTFRTGLGHGHYIPAINNLDFSYLSGFAFCYITILACLIAVSQHALRQGEIYRKQALLIVCAVLPPLTFDVFATMGFWGLDRSMGPVGYSISGILLWIAIGRYKLLDIVPLALREVFDNMNTGVIVVDSHRCIIDANKMAKTYLSSVINLDSEVRLDDVVSRLNSVAKASRGLSEVVNTQLEAQVERLNAEVEFDDCNNSTRIYRLAFDPIVHSDARTIGSVVIIEDVTSERNLMDSIAKVNLELLANREEMVKQYERLRDAQAQLIQSEKMASLGLLVAGVAHEINTPLGTINGNTGTRELISARLQKALATGIEPEDPGVAKLLKALSDIDKVDQLACRRILDIVRSLRNFSRLDEAEFQEANIHDGIDSTLVLLHNMLKTRIVVNKEYGNIPPIMCFPNQLNQVFLNLLVNASQAIEGTGTITIRTEMAGDDSIRVSIIDSGKGIPEENIARIFNPGFTTKGVGVGTGLGLSICYKIVEGHGGSISVNSEVGKGSEFSVLLPVIATKNATA